MTRLLALHALRAIVRDLQRAGDLSRRADGQGRSPHLSSGSKGGPSSILHRRARLIRCGNSCRRVLQGNKNLPAPGSFAGRAQKHAHHDVVNKVEDSHVESGCAWLRHTHVSPIGPPRGGLSNRGRLSAVTNSIVISYSRALASGRCASRTAAPVTDTLKRSALLAACFAPSAVSHSAPWGGEILARHRVYVL